jgi:glycosyltransferase involved in cell wall biosynthesis
LSVPASPHITIDLRLIDASGMGTYLSNVVPGVIASLPDTRFTLIGQRERLVSLRDCQTQFPIDMIDSETPIYSIAEQWTVYRHVPRDTDLLWSPHYNIPFLYRGKLLVTVYDLFHLAMPEIVGGLHKRLYARAMFRGVARKADAILAISQFTKNEFLRLVDEGRKDIVVTHLGVRPEAGTQVARPHANPYILFVGNVKPHKNLSALLRAFQKVSNQVPDDLVIVGKKEGFITGDVAVMRGAEEIPGRVYFTGKIDAAMLRAYYQHATAFVFPSLYEGFGLPPLEAMAAGCPVACSRAASLPEVCGDAAYYFDPNDIAGMALAVQRVITDQALRATLKARGEKRASELTWERTIQQTVKVVKGVLGR